MTDWLAKAEAAKAELDAVPRWRWIQRWRLRERWLAYVSFAEAHEWLRFGSDRRKD